MYLGDYRVAGYKPNGDPILVSNTDGSVYQPQKPAKKVLASAATTPAANQTAATPTPAQQQQPGQQQAGGQNADHDPEWLDHYLDSEAVKGSGIKMKHALGAGAFLLTLFALAGKR